MAKPPNAIKETASKKKAVRRRQKTRITMSDLQVQIDNLQRQLESERLERHLLIETLHHLGRLVSVKLAPPPTDETESTGDMDLTDLTNRAASRGMASRTPCTITDEEQRWFILACINRFNKKKIKFGLETNFGHGGLGWDNKTKRLPFNPIFRFVRSFGCHFSATADDFENFDTVEDMVNFVKENSKHSFA